jgi:ribonuclease R
MEQQQETRQRPISASATALAEEEMVASSAAEDLSGRPVVQGITLDGPTSKDLDDAFWLERSPQGGYQLQVSIADVGSWITPDLTPALDRAAFRKAFTRYDGDRYRPMLPRRLSEDRLSLLEGQLRPAVTIALPLDADLRPGELRIAQTSLCSKKRLSYAAAEDELDHPQTEIAPMLQLAYKLAQGLLQARRLRGALAIYHLPTGWTTTEDGFLRNLDPAERYKAQLITAEFMILANQAFAYFFAHQGLPALYRNQKATAIAPERFTLLHLLDTAVQQPMVASPERVRATFQLAIERARYAPTLEGHFGLNLPAYVHMTSPLRRYPDLINQRILLAALNGERSPYSKEALEQIAKAVNGHEHAMKEAKRTHFLAVHDQQVKRIVAADTQDLTASGVSLADLDAKLFHSVIRMAAERQILFPAIEQEVLRRLEEHQLYAHDLFTLVFRFNTNGAAWERVKAEALHALEQTPEHATSILVMGQRALGWSPPIYELFSNLEDRTTSFQARVTVNVAGQEYVSAWHRAKQRQQAKHLAGVEVLLRIAGKNDAAASDDFGEFSHSQAASSTRRLVQPNYKGQLVERIQANQWDSPVYTERGRSGPSHAPLFTVEGVVQVQGTKYTAQGEGMTKAQAEQDAARRLLQLLPQTLAEALIQAAAPDTLLPMSALHEMQQKGAVKDVAYAYARSGSEHEALFTCVCTVTVADDRTLTGTGTGKTKRQGAQAAASQALARLSAGDALLETERQ